MLVVYSDDELLHNPNTEITGGVIKKYVESPERLIAIKQFIDTHDEFQIVAPDDYSLGPLLDVHGKDYVDFLQHIYEEWVAEGLPADACMGDTFSRMSTKLDPEIIFRNAHHRASAKLGYYTSDMSVSFMKDTWRATYCSAQVALSAGHRLVEMVEQQQHNACIYALCRPPGHHSAQHLSAGYCYINNAAVVARFLQNYSLQEMNRARQGDHTIGSTCTQKKKIVIVDIDYHHGNGTQDIFYDDASVFYISLHGSPDYPFFTGSVEEKGRGEGLGFNINVPLDPHTTTDEIYLENLFRVLNDPSVIAFNADYVIVSMGLDTWCEDPIAGMKGLVDIETYKHMGYLIKTSAGTCDRPTLFVQEGGYTIDKLGVLAGSILQGYLNMK